MERFNKDAYDVVVIGSGAAGMSAAHIAARARQKVALIERDHYLGGECPNYACVPTKALLHVAKLYHAIESADRFGLQVSRVTPVVRLIQKYKDHVVSQTGGRNLTAKRLAESGIVLIRGEAKFLDQHTLSVNGKNIPFRQAVIATGSDTFIPPLEGINQVDYLISKSAISLSVLPKSIIILGGGPVGCEFAQFFNYLGVDVTILQRSDRILEREEPEISALVQEIFSSNHIQINTHFNAEKVEQNDKAITVYGTNKDGQAYYTAERILIAAGQKPNIAGLNLDKIGVSVNQRGIEVNEYLQTNLPHIYAAGDVVGDLMFTHTAHEHGSIVGNNLVNKQKRKVDFRVVPRATFVDPEVASVGRTEESLKKQGINVVTGIANVASLGRALTDSQQQGLIKVVADKGNGEILGASLIAPRGGELIHELALSMQARLSVEVIAQMIHAYPTYSEAIGLACYNAARQL